ncbi:aldehyde dehydrogenase [Mycobacterium sp. NPDC003449]
MTTLSAPVQNGDSFYIGGEWVESASGASLDVLDSGTGALYYRVAEANAEDVSRAVGAARKAFDDGPWPRMSHAERAVYLIALARAIEARTEDLAQLWTRESGVIYSIAQRGGAMGSHALDAYAELASSYAFEEPGLTSMWGGFGLLRREPVGVVGAIFPWNGPLEYIVHKAGPALLAGCTVVLKSPPQAPGAAHVVAECAAAVGLPPGVLNFVTADREVSELLVTDPRVDKISFTGSTAAGRRIASLCGERVARVTLELGGKSAAVVLDDADISAAAMAIGGMECFLTGQVCASLTRVVVTRDRHDAMVEALAGMFSQVKVGDPFDDGTQMGPLATEAQRERVERYIALGCSEGATLATGGGRPEGVPGGWFIEPTLFGNVDSSHTIAQEEIFGPVLSVIAAEDERDAVRIANDTIYGLNAAVFTTDADRALDVSKELRSGTVGHNGFKPDFGIAFGGYKQSGIGREGGREGLASYLETKTVVLDSAPSGYGEH